MIGLEEMVSRVLGVSRSKDRGERKEWEGLARDGMGWDERTYTPHVWQKHLYSQ